MMEFLLTALLLVPAQEQRPIASTNDWAITREQYEAILKTFPEADRLRYVEPEYRRGLVNELIRIWVLCTEARKNGIAIPNDYESQKGYYQKYAQQIGALVNEEAVRKYYDDHIDDFTALGFSHILILNGDSPITPYPGVERLPYKEAEALAKEVKAKLNAGGDWNELSKKYSQAIDIKDKGGSAGYLLKGRFEKSIENALFALKLGEISDVVGSVYGFHILRLDDKQVKPFEELHDPIRQKLVTDEVNRQLDLKVKAAGVTVDESFVQN
jgi:hypothetical protein